MHSPTPRPENAANEAPDRSAAAAESSEADARSARRGEAARAAAPVAANLKLLDRRAAAAREASRREEPAKPAASRPPAAEPRRPAEVPMSVSGTRRRIALLRRVQLAVTVVGVASLGLFLLPVVPPYAPAAVLCVCLLTNAYLGWGLLRPLSSLSLTARAVALGDFAARAPAGDAGEFAEIARTLNALLDERAATIAQNNEQQQRLQNDIHQLAVVVGAAAAGDLSPRAKVQSGSLGKLADELNLTLETFAQLVHAVRSSSAVMLEVAGQAQEVAAYLQQSTARQGSGIESGAGVLRHVAERTDVVTANAQVATEAARRTGETAQEGGRTLQRLLEGMVTVRRNAQGSAAKMKRLGERAVEISTIVGAISRISAQTNMLALNAAIEASRAGEHGLGFTVVADEVRKLAEDCEEATKEIARLITAIQSETGEAVSDLERQAGEVERQSQLASDAGGALERIVGVAQQSAKLVAEISEAAHQQTGDAAGLRDMMHGTGQVSRDLQAAAERAQRTIEALHTAASDLSRRAAAFRSDGGETASV